MSRFCVIVIIVSCGLMAQTPDTATVRGRVLDQSHAGIARVEVAATNTLTGLKRTSQTDDSGNFSLSGLPVAGSYNIVANKSGFAEGRLSNVTLEGGTTANVDLQLNVAGGQTEVTVTGVAGEVRTDQPQLGVHLDAQADGRDAAARIAGSPTCRC